MIELLVSIGIFVFMTALVVVKYGNFNQSVLLTDLAYDVALTIRTAQTYGVSVKSTTNDFSASYGTTFTTQTLGNGVGAAANNAILLFRDTNQPAPNGIFELTDQIVSAYAIKRGAIVSEICVDSGVSCSSANNASVVDVSFIRPNPDAVICGKSRTTGSTRCNYDYAEIKLKGTDGNTRRVAVYRNGQISVLDQ